MCHFMDLAGDEMKEQSYECRRTLGAHATRLTYYIYDNAPDAPDLFLLRGVSRKSGRRFCVAIMVRLGCELAAEVAAINFVKEE